RAAVHPLQGARRGRRGPPPGRACRPGLSPRTAAFRRPSRRGRDRGHMACDDSRQLRLPGQGTAMRIGLVVDSACDLPPDFFERERVEILPIPVRIGDATQVDHRDEAQTLAFLESHIAERGANAETIPYSPEQIRDLFLERLVVEYDYVFCMTIAGSRS